jgi:ABC-type spermidine/putrescine transport system permease subunit II
MWTLITESVPAHLEAGPLVRDPLNAASLYAGFSLLPYQEIWQRSASQRSALAHVSVTSLIAGTFALTVVIAVGVGGLLRLGRYYRLPVRDDLSAGTVRSRQFRGDKVP